MIVRLQATAATLTVDEIKQAVPQEVMAELKQKDPKPLLQAYSVVKEGISRPKIIGEGTTPILWPRKAIEAVGRAITRGLQFFKGHNKDSSHDGRESFGEVVGKITKEIGGKLHQIVVGYFPNKEDTADCDICSIEADAVLKSDDSNNLIAQAITKLTGIALANSEDEIPGFAGAVRLGRIQAFEPEDPDDPEGKKKQKQRKEIPMTFEEVKKYITEHNVWPNQLFNEDVLKNDRVFGKVYNEHDALKSQFAELEKSNKTLKEDSEKIQKAALRSGADARFKKFFPEGTTDKQKEFLEKGFDPEKLEDLSDDGLKKVVEDGLEDFKKMASIFGEPKKDDPTKKKEDNPANDDHENLSDVDKVVNDITEDDEIKK